MRIDKWDTADADDHLPEKDCETEDKAVFVGERPTNHSVVIAEDTEEEWIVFENLDPLDLANAR